MPRFGLIGRTLAHSFSRRYFAEKFRAIGRTDCVYELVELPAIDAFPSLSVRERFSGLNVTVPYKESIIPYLDEIDETAAAIGAVNCIRISGGKMKGYNTDAYGFAQSVKPFIGGHERALILGTGGSSKAVAYVLRKLGLEVMFVSSSKTTGGNIISYKEVNAHVMNAFTCVVNCTPLGMYPAVTQAPPLPYDHFTERHFAYDLIYNPSETAFLRRAGEKGAVTVNGLSMLKLQAEKSWEIWNSA